MTIIPIPQNTENSLQSLPHGLPQDLMHAVPDAEAVAQRFIASFKPAVEKRVESTVNELLADEFPRLLENPAFVRKIMSAVGPEAIEDQPFVFLAKNPNYTPKVSVPAV